MKRIVSVFVFLIVFQNGWSQLGFDLGMGSQSAKMQDVDAYKQYFSFAAGVRYQMPAVFVKLGIRQSIAREMNFKRVEDDMGTHDIFGGTSNGKYGPPGKFSEKGIVLGLGLTFSGSSSNTRPYLMFEYSSLTTAQRYEAAQQLVVEDSRSGTGYRPVRNEVFKHRTGQVRFAGGFQFALGTNLTLYNEASINFNNNSLLYNLNVSIDLGLRYFLGNTQ